MKRRGPAKGGSHTKSQSEHGSLSGLFTKSPLLESAWFGGTQGIPEGREVTGNPGLWESRDVST